MNLNDLFNEEKVRLDPKCWKGKKIGNPKTKMKGGVRVNNCVPAESVAEGSLNEFAPAGDEGNGPYAYGIAIIRIGEDYIDYWKDYPAEGSDEDAAAIIQVGKTFISRGMKAGIAALFNLDTMLEDHIMEHLVDQGFNVKADLYAHSVYAQTAAAKPAQKVHTEDDIRQMILSLLQQFAQVRKDPEDQQEISGIYQAFQTSMQTGFETLYNAWEYDIDADFTKFALQHGLDLNAAAAKYYKDPNDDDLDEEWSEKYKRSINCANPRGFSQRAHCAGRKKNEDVAEAAGQPLSVQQLATISDAALDQAYGYGRSTPGNTFGWQANLKSAAYAKQMIDQGVTDIEAISDAIHKGWNTTAQAFVRDPDQFDDTAKLAAAGKLEAKLQQRAQLMKQNYAQLPEDEKEKDRVVARALLQAIKGQQNVDEGGDVFMPDIKDTPEYKAGFATGKLPVPYPEGTQQYASYYKGVIDKASPTLSKVGEGEQRKGADYRDPKEVNYDDEYDAMVARVKKLAGLGPLKTVYDPQKRVYRNMPTAVQPKK